MAVVLQMHWILQDIHLTLYEAIKLHRLNWIMFALFIIFLQIRLSLYHSSSSLPSHFSSFLQRHLLLSCSFTSLNRVNVTLPRPHLKLVEISCLSVCAQLSVTILISHLTIYKICTPAKDFMTLHYTLLTILLLCWEIIYALVLFSQTKSIIITVKISCVHCFLHSSSSYFFFIVNRI